MGIRQLALDTDINPALGFVVSPKSDAGKEAETSWFAPTVTL